MYNRGMTNTAARNQNTATEITFADGTSTIRRHRNSLGSFAKMVATVEAETGTKFSTWTITEGWS